MSTANATARTILPGSAGLGTAIGAPSSARSPRTGATSAPQSLPGSAARSSGAPLPMIIRRRRSSGDQHTGSLKIPASPGARSCSMLKVKGKSLMDSAARAQGLEARKFNDSLVYLEGPQIYTCGHCRTHLTSHDEIISKSFHGRHGRAYLFDNCVNVDIGPAEDRTLMTGLHSVNDIFCKRCKHLIGWTYSKAYEFSQKYKEGKFIVEKINLHLEESDYYDIAPPAGARKDRFRARSISWGSESHRSLSSRSRSDSETIYEYRPSSPMELSKSPRSSFSK